MQAMLTSTTKIVHLVVDGVAVPARIWEGVTERGVPFHAYITRVAVADGDDEQFAAELLEQREPTPAVAAIPAVLIL